MRTLRFLPVLLLVGICRAEAADPKPFTITGDFAFESAELKDGKPVCIERWRFTPAGELTVFSGQEVVTARYRVDVIPGEPDSEHWLVREDLSSNGQPDCQQRRSNQVRAGEQRLYFYFAAAGNLVFCKSGGSGKDRLLEPIWLVSRARESDPPGTDSAPRPD